MAVPSVTPPPLAARVGDSRTVHADLTRTTRLAEFFIRIRRHIETPVALAAGAGLAGNVIRNVVPCPFTCS